MKFRRQIAAAGVLGILSPVGMADDIAWRSSGMPTAIKQARADMPVEPGTVPANPQWKPTTPEKTSWHSQEAKNAPTTPLMLPEIPVVSPDVITFLPIPDSSAANQPSPALADPKNQKPKPRLEPAPIPRPTEPPPSKELPLPRPIPTPAAPPKKTPPASHDTPSWMIKPPAPTTPPSPKPTGTPGTAPAASPTPAATPTPAVQSASYSVWGGYVSADGSQPSSAPATPVRNGTFGSPDLRLSRDYHFLDGLMKPIDGPTDEKVLFPNNANPANPSVERFSLQAEYLLWWVRASQIPVLATTAGSQTYGFLGQPGTDVLLGPGNFGPSLRDGLRLRGYAALTCDGSYGVDGSFFFLGRRSSTTVLDSSEYPTILRPIFVPNFNSEFGELLAYPGLSTGSLTVNQTSSLWGADLNARKALICGCDRWLAGFAGFRYLNLRETLTITENITAGTEAPVPVNTKVVVQDQFAVRNQFYGGQVGITGAQRWGRFSLEGRGSIALGVTHQQLDINGSQAVTVPGEATQNFNGGLLAVGPNLGQFTKNRFSVVPELTLNVGYALTPGLKVYAGYNFLYWSNVLRPGDQIDRVVDLTFVPNAPSVPFSGQNRPAPTFQTSGFWAQGIQFGIEARW